MTILINLLAQTRTGAIIEIIIMLLITGIIAYLTAYYYYKPIYTKKINKLETDILEMEKENNGLKSELVEMEEHLKKKDEELKKVKEQKK